MAEEEPNKAKQAHCSVSFQKSKALVAAAAMLPMKLST